MSSGPEIGLLDPTGLVNRVSVGMAEIFVSNVEIVVTVLYR